MKKKAFIPCGILAFTIAGILSAAPVQTSASQGTISKAEAIKPVLSGNAIVCGNKTVTWTAVGQISISSGKRVLLSLIPHFVYMNEQKKVDWISFTKNECQVKAE